jgi:RND superfamily putative drug exporter
MRSAGELIVRHSKLILFGFVGLIALSTIWGFGVFSNLKGGGYDNPNSDSALVSEILAEDFKVDAAEVIVLVDLPGRADELNGAGVPNQFDLVQRLSDELAAIDGVIEVLNYYTLGQPPTLISEDGKLVYVLVDLDNSIAQSPVVARIVDGYTGNYQGADVHVAGFGAVTKAINETIEHDLIRAEIIAVPIVLLLLIFILVLISIYNQKRLLIFL